jgi:hypothetical protein
MLTASWPERQPPARTINIWPTRALRDSVAPVTTILAAVASAVVINLSPVNSALEYPWDFMR